MPTGTVVLLKFICSAALCYGLWLVFALALELVNQPVTGFVCAGIVLFGLNCYAAFVGMYLIWLKNWRLANEKNPS
jgi:hypothetical protein